MALGTPVAGIFATDSSAQTLEVPPPAGISDGEILCIAAFANDNVTVSTPEAGWTKDSEIQSTTAGDKTIALFLKIASSESGDYTIDIDGGVNEILKGVCFRIAGNSATQPDTASQAHDGSFNSDTMNPDPITTANDGSLVFSICGATQTIATPGSQPSGYQKLTEEGTITYLGVAYKLVPTAGVEDPGTWSGLGATADSVGITMAIRSDAGGGVTALQTQNYQGMNRMNGGFRS